MTLRIALFVCLLSTSWMVRGADELLQRIKQMPTAYASVKDYTATFMRREVLRGKQRPEETISLKFREPLQVYMRWLSGSAKDREAIFVKGRDNDKVLVHEPGWLSGRFTVVLPPDGSSIMGRSRHPFDEIGIGRVIDLIVATFEKANQTGELEMRDLGATREDGREMRVIEGILPKDPAKNYYCYRAIVTIDEGWKLPVTVKVYDWNDKLVEHYRYSNIQINPGLTDLDFSTENPDYKFPKTRINRR
jgi:outer membrane lipoprotein-sorting protein